MCNCTLGIRTIGILHRDNLLIIIKIMKEWCEDPPTSVELIVTHKVGMIPLQRIQDEGLIRFRDDQITETPAVSEVELCNCCLHAETREFRVHLDVNTLIGLDTNDEFIAGNVLKYAACDILELDANLGLLLIESCNIVSSIKF